MPGAVRAALTDPFVKLAGDDLPGGDVGVPGLKHLADVMGWRAGPVNAHWGGPTPLANLLIGAGLGGLGGYGVGRLAEHVLPDRYFDKGVLRRRTAQLGAVLGAAPAVWQGYDNFRQTGAPEALAAPWPQAAPGEASKVASDLFSQSINRDRFTAAVMADDSTPLPLRAATAGLVEAAAVTAGSSVVTPWDVARVAAGAGTGLVSGMLAGKALGFLAGLNEAGQSALQRAGVWSGVINTVVPRALGLS